ncbi:MAG: SBBP repeat-containing protein [Candidatus Sulfotelmatobacter sp.]
MFDGGTLPKLLVAFLLVGSGHAGRDAPKLVYGTYLGGRDKECATGIAVDRSGDAYIVGRTPSPDFPVTPGSFSTKTSVNNNDWVGFVSRIGPDGDHLLYSSFIGGNFRSSANAVAVDSQGRAFVAGSTCSSAFPTTNTAVLRTGLGSRKIDACDGFLAWLSPDGSRLEYATYLGGSAEDSATAIALSPTGDVIYVGGYTTSSDSPVTPSALQNKLEGATNGFFSAIDTQSGSLLYSTYLGGAGNDRVTGIAVDASAQVYVSGVTDSPTWPKLRLDHIGRLGATDGFVVRFDMKGRGAPSGVRIGGSGEESLDAISLDSTGNVYVVGSTNSPNFPVKGINRAQVGGAFVSKLSGKRFDTGTPALIWSRRFGGSGDDALLAVSAGMQGSVFVSGRSGSKDLPTTAGAFYRQLAADNDSILARLRASDGQLQFATFIGGTRLPASWYNDEATGVFASPNGDVYVTGCSLDDRVPISPGALQPRPKGNSEPFVLRIDFAPSD